MASKPNRTRASSPSPSRRAPSAGSGGKLTSPVRPTTPSRTYTSKPVDIGFAGPEHRFARADLEIQGIYHGEASYEGRVFLNNRQADAATPKTLENGYAGSFNIFGHGGCTGDSGHCDVNGTRVDPFDLRNPHPLTPARKRVTVTEALKSIALTSATATITIVPIVTAANEFCDTSDVFRCDEMRFVSYNA